LVTENAILSRAVSHLFLTNQGKCLRPAIIALIGRALSGGQISSYLESEVRNSHRQLALIAEMIHAASLIHDDVLDNAKVRRGSPSVHTVYSSKVAVLAGDFLLARASVLLARLHNYHVVELVASCLDSLVQGEILQSSANKDELSDMKFYLRKSYLKTASLICNTCKATALLSGYDESDPITLATEEFGFHLGMAFQIVDDILDFSGTSSSLGKPTQVDMRLGLATAPVLFAAQEFKELLPLIERRFNLKDDVSNAVSLALQTDCVERSFALAEYHANKAMMATLKLPSSEARLALQRIVHFVIARNK
jgi:geranylgeranyl pyrophosphate synthase